MNCIYAISSILEDLLQQSNAKMWYMHKRNEMQTFSSSELQQQLGLARNQQRPKVIKNYYEWSLISI